MADVKISGLPAATTPLAGTEVLPIVQSTTTKKVAVSDLTAGRSVSAASLSLTTTPLAVTSGGTGLATVAQGDLLYGSASNTLSALAKNTTATRYLANTGTSNNPAWAQVDLTNGVTGTLPTSNGGTGLTSFTANGVVYASSTSALATGSALTFDGTNLSTTGNVVIATSGKGIDFSATPGTGTSELLADYEEGTWTGSVTTDGTPPTTVSTATGYYTKIGRQVTVRFVKNTFNMSGSTGNFTVTGLPYTSSSSSGNTAVGSVVFFKVDLPANTMNLSAVINDNSTSVVFYASLDQANYQQVADNATTDGRVWFTVTYDV